MMEAVSGKAEIYRQMEAPLLPLFRRCMEQDAEDYFEEMLELLSCVKRRSNRLIPSRWALATGPSPPHQPPGPRHAALSPPLTASRRLPRRAGT